MTERLIIRLASNASQTNHWLIWSDNEDEIIASGQVDNASQLKLLAEKAQQRKVICLLPSVDVCIKEITINGPFNRQMQQALPYLIEEEVATDVELLHLSLLSKQTDSVTVAICDKTKMGNWIDWLNMANISCQQFIPEGLALPVGDDSHWQAVKLDQQWLIRESKYQAWACESSMLDMVLESKLPEELDQKIVCYSTQPNTGFAEWQEASLTLPMELLVKGTLNNKINLLTGEFAPKKATNKHLRKWRLAIVLGGVLLTLLMVNLYLQHIKVERQTEFVKQQVETIYQKAFPLQSKLKYTRIKKKLKSMLDGLNNGPSDSSFLLMLNELVPVFASIPEIKPTNLKFDANKQELRLQVSANNFQAFEKFSTALPKHLDLEQGALNSSKDRVSGLLTIRKK